MTKRKNAKSVQRQLTSILRFAMAELTRATSKTTASYANLATSNTMATLIDLRGTKGKDLFKNLAFSVKVDLSPLKKLDDFALTDAQENGVI